MPGAAAQAKKLDLPEVAEAVVAVARVPQSPTIALELGLASKKLVLLIEFERLYVYSTGTGRESETSATQNHDELLQLTVEGPARGCWFACAVAPAPAVSNRES